MADTCITPGCGKETSHQHLPISTPTGKYVQQGYCFTCSYWQARAEQDRTDPRAFIVEHDEKLHHYVAGTRTDGNPRNRGSYGEHFRIRLSDGRVIGTFDLWQQGTVPEAWTHLFDKTLRGIFL